MWPMSKRPPFETVLAARLSRRALVTSGAVALGLAATPQSLPAAGTRAGKSRDFVGLKPDNKDAFQLAKGYRYNIVARWGDALTTGVADFDTRKLATEEWLDADAVKAQENQFGTNCDAVAYFPLTTGRAARGLLCVNHEYVNGELIWPNHRGSGMKYEERKAWLARHPDAVAWLQAAHGVSVMQVKRDANGWELVRGARETRRITARTPMEIAGPARAHPLMRTNADPTGTRVFGTFANCAGGKTPWGTYLTSEENMDDYFAGGRTLRERGDAVLNEAHRRHPMRERSFYGWEEQDPRFDLRHEPHEPFRFGWMVEIDPTDPASVPRKRTALGRFQHEGANTIVGKTGHVAAYMGDDEEFEYVYKFVTRGRFDAANPAANRDLLDDGTLYVARFDADGTGEWLPLVHDEDGPLNSRAGFTNQGDVVIRVRAAADLLGGTPMDRPEEVEPNPVTGRIYVACTKSPNRGKWPEGDVVGRKIDMRPNAANPRPNNQSGHIIEIAESGNDHTATRFEWNVFLLAGDPQAGRFIVDATELVPGGVGNADTYFAGFGRPDELVQIHCPDNLGVDPQGRLWIVTDTDRRNLPNNGCFVVPTTGPDRGWLRQLAIGPVGCEMCGCEFTPDGSTLFLTIQHPGEGGTLSKPRSEWPDGKGRPPRASLVAVERKDGGPI